MGLVPCIVFVTNRTETLVGCGVNAGKLTLIIFRPGHPWCGNACGAVDTNFSCGHLSTVPVVHNQRNIAGHFLGGFGQVTNLMCPLAAAMHGR